MANVNITPDWLTERLGRKITGVGVENMGAAGGLNCLMVSHFGEEM